MSRLFYCCALLFSLGAEAQADAGLARGWYTSGSNPAAYEVTHLERGVCGTKAIRAAARSPEAKGPIGVLQSFRADDYRGKRLRYSATVEVQAVGGWAGLFFRAEAAERKTLSFDDMRTRPLRGTRKCVRLSVVATIPAEAELITLGVGLQGSGAVELSDIAVEPVSAEVPVTTGLALARGNVGGVWFTETLITTNEAERLGKLTQRAPGLWRDEQGDFEGQIDGERVLARIYSTETGGTPLPLSGAFTISHEAGVTTIEGTWGTSAQSYPVSVRLSATQLDMQWGFYERHLKAEPAPQMAQGCVFFAQQAGPTSYSDMLQVCGATLSPSPPPVQTVVAFLMTGFRRFGHGIALQRPAVAPVPPGRGPQ